MSLKIEAELKQELVKGFNSIVREEVRKHNSAIKNNQEDIDSMKRMIESFKSDYEGLRHSNESMVCSILNDFGRKKNEIESSILSLKDFVNSYKKEFKEAIDSIKSSTHDAVNLDTLKGFSLELNSKMDSEVKRIKESIACMRAEIDNFLGSRDLDLCEYKKKISENTQRMSESLEELEKNLRISRVDAEGVMQELKIYKKSMYIIEKKIENIYTLIERLQKKAETCPSKD